MLLLFWYDVLLFLLVIDASNQLISVNFLEKGGTEGGGRGELIGCNQLILTLNYERANLSKGRNASFTFLLLVKLEWKQITDYHFLFYQIECKITSAG